MTDRSLGQPPQVLAHYRVTAGYALAPLDVGTIDYRASPAPIQRDGVVGSLIPMPNGQQVFVAIGNGAQFHENR